MHICVHCAGLAMTVRKLYRRQSSDSIMKCKGVRLVRIRMAVKITHSNHTPLKLSQFWPNPGGIILVKTVWGR